MLGCASVASAPTSNFPGLRPGPLGNYPHGPLRNVLTHAHATHIHTSGRSGTPCRPQNHIGVASYRAVDFSLYGCVSGYDNANKWLILKLKQNFVARPNVHILPWRCVCRAPGRLRARGCGHGWVASASDMRPTDPPIARLRGGSRGLVLVGRSLGGGGWAGSRAKAVPCGVRVAAPPPSAPSPKSSVRARSSDAAGGGVTHGSAAAASSDTPAPHAPSCSRSGARSAWAISGSVCGARRRCSCSLHKR